MLSVRSLSFRYRDTSVIRGLSLDVAPGDCMILRGESGCGKSTLLRLLCRLEAPQDGEMSLDGESYEAIPSHDLRRRVAYLQQIPVMLDGSVRDMLLLSQRYDRKHGNGISDSGLRDMLVRARLSDVDLDKNARDLSVGQQQRVALIRLLVMRPDYLLLDEPAAALDANSASIIHEWIADVHREHATSILMVTHAPLPDAPTVARRLLMNGGTLLEDAA